MDQAVRYRSLSMNTNPNRLRREGAEAEHRAILDAVLDHDAARACQLLEEHYRITLDTLRDVTFDAGDGRSGERTPRAAVR
jgi:DNA-binding GntR family transcriptional regulator